MKGDHDNKLYIVENFSDKLDDKNDKSSGDDFQAKIMPEMKSERDSNWKTVLS